MTDIAGNPPALIRTKLLVLTPGRAPRMFERDLYEQPDQQIVKAIIEPLLGLAPMEHVGVLLNGERVDMFVDAESALKGMPQNDEATALFRKTMALDFPDSDPNEFAAIFGPAVITLRRIWFHD